MSLKKKKNIFKRPPTDVMTHATLWVILSTAFFILNFYAQTVSGYTIFDPQIYQFLIAPLIWGAGVGLHALASQILNRPQRFAGVSRSLRHSFRDIHIGVFIAFFMMLYSMGTTASITGTGELSVITTLFVLLAWFPFLASHSWLVYRADKHQSKKFLSEQENQSPDISRLVDNPASNDENIDDFSARNNQQIADTY